jgi:septal ring factor EnvC (AmiA/AmiB activator)
MNVMASAESVFDLLKRRKSMEFILKSDEELLNNQHKNLTLLTDLQTRLNEKKQVNEALEADYKQQIAVIQQNKSQRKGLLNDIRQKKSLSLAAIQSLKEAAEELTRTVQSLKKDVEEAPVEEKPVKGSFLARKGQLQLPVNGKIVSFFGASTNNEFRVQTFNSGIQVRADRGEPIHAVAPGQVLFADWLKGYGNMIIVDHGHNYYSLYCHTDEVFKKKGDMVEDREVIATVGDTGSLSGPGLYFEIRHRGEPVDPLGWFKKGDG